MMTISRNDDVVLIPGTYGRYSMSRDYVVTNARTGKVLKRARNVYTLMLPGGRRVSGIHVNKLAARCGYPPAVYSQGISIRRRCAAVGYWFVSPIAAARHIGCNASCLYKATYRDGLTVYGFSLV